MSLIIAQGVLGFNGHIVAMGFRSVVLTSILQFSLLASAPISLLPPVDISVVTMLYY